MLFYLCTQSFNMTNSSYASSDSEAEGEAVHSVYQERKHGDACYPKNCLGGNRVPFSVFELCRKQMDLVRGNGNDAKRATVCAMMVGFGNVLNQRSRLNYRLFGYKDVVCYDAFCFCFNIPGRIVTRWRREDRQRRSFVPPTNLFSGRDGTLANRSTNQFDRSRAVAFIANMASDMEKQGRTDQMTYNSYRHT